MGKKHDKQIAEKKVRDNLKDLTDTPEGKAGKKDPESVEEQLARERAEREGTTQGASISEVGR